MRVDCHRALDDLIDIRAMQTVGARVRQLAHGMNDRYHALTTIAAISHGTIRQLAKTLVTCLANGFTEHLRA